MEDRVDAAGLDINAQEALQDIARIPRLRRRHRDQDQHPTEQRRQLYRHRHTHPGPAHSPVVRTITKKRVRDALQHEKCSRWA